MRLDKELFNRGLVSSRTEAAELISLGKVYVNEVQSTKLHQDIQTEDVLRVDGGRRYVSRGGEKLDGALSYLRVDVKGMTALDIGSSTGGFTDCLLDHGALKVIAVDVGSNQLHTKLRSDPRVTLFEETDIRNFTTDITFDLIVVDASFISLAHIVEAVQKFSHAGTKLIALIKPQFEVGKGNTKKGIVKDEKLYDDVITTISKTYEDCGFTILEIFDSPMLGGDGNKEFFMYAKYDV